MPIDRERLFSFLSNISDFDKEYFSKINTQETFSYNDIISLQINSFQQKKIPLGIKYNIEKSYPIFTNPFEIIEFGNILKNKEENIVSTFNKDLLLDYDITNNTIYLCNAEDVLEYFKTNKFIDSELLTKLYFPFLHKKNINNLESLKEQKYDLLENNKNLLSKKFLKNIDVLATTGKILKTAGKVIKPLSYAMGPYAVFSAQNKAEAAGIDLNLMDKIKAFDAGDADVAIDSYKRRTDPEFAAAERAKDLAKMTDDFEEVGKTTFGKYNDQIKNIKLP